MPSMPYYFLGKGSQFAMLDQQFGGNNFMDEYDAALARLEGTTARPLSDLADAHSDPSSGLQQGLTGNDAQHFRDHWLDNVGGWWTNTHTEEILRAGFVEAIRHAKQVEKPIETWWVCADEKSFQVYICEGPRQITVIVYTPKPVHEDPSAMTEDEPIWVVKEREPYDQAPLDELSQGGSPVLIKKRVMCRPGPAHARNSA
jgi:hypothetical protein